uniref:FAD/NAD(P)-binding domain-containing protein n=1 Tax=Aegilops tauschii subsp. strangulata TaxID=200361 RepID=A0A453FZR0_AEGTS
MSEGDRLYRTSSGIEITADCYFSCLDRPLSSSWIRGSELEDCLDNDGRLMVDANLRVKGQVNIFAAGDIIDIPVCSYCTSISAVEVPVDAFISFTNFHYLTEGWFIQYLLVDILLHMWF